jgi:hypothetical protein
LERRISALALSQKPTLELTQEFVETYKQKTAYEKYPLNTVLALGGTRDTSRALRGSLFVAHLADCDINFRRRHSPRIRAGVHATSSPVPH